MQYKYDYNNYKNFKSINKKSIRFQINIMKGEKAIKK